MKKGKELIQEIETCMVAADAAAFWWLGQLSFAVKLGNRTFYLDPFLSDHPDRRVPSLLQPEEVTNADYIVGSHDHLDHIDREVWKQLSVSSPSAKFIVPKLLLPALAEDLKIAEERFIGLDDGMTLTLEDGFTITGVAAAHEFLDQDPKTGAYPYLGTVLEGNGCKIYHSGDTCVYEGLYQKLRNFGTMDIMFLPINGRSGRRYRANTIGNMTYQEAVDLAGSLKPGLVVPGHYEMFEFNSEDPALFVDYLAAKFPQNRCWIGGHGELVRYGHQESSDAEGAHFVREGNQVMNQKERMQAGLPYKAWLDGLAEERLENKKKIYEFNNLPPERWSESSDLLKKIFGKTGKTLHVEAPFHCDYGYNIEVGENFYANYNLVILDVGKVIIGKNVQIAPNVSIYTAGHPVHPDSRNSGYEYGIDITIGDNVWIGGSTSVMPGVRIGNNVVIGGGSVVTRDLPDDVIAVGNPCRVVRKITEEDRKYYFKDREFDVNDYE